MRIGVEDVLSGLHRAIVWCHGEQSWEAETAGVVCSGED